MDLRSAVQDRGMSNVIAPSGTNKGTTTALLQEEEVYTEQEATLETSERPLPRSCSRSNSSTSTTTGTSTGGTRRRQDFQHQLREQVAAAQHGHRGLEAALSLMCERLLDLEECWGRVQEVRLRIPLLLRHLVRGDNVAATCLIEGKGRQDSINFVCSVCNKKSITPPEKPPRNKTHSSRKVRREGEANKRVTMSSSCDLMVVALNTDCR